MGAVSHQLPLSDHNQTHVVVNTEVIPLAWVSVSVTVEMTTIVAVVTDPEPVTVTVAPLDSIVHCVGNPDEPTVMVGIFGLEVPLMFLNRLEAGLR